MAKDAIVEETRGFRDDLAKAHDYDVKKIVRALQRDEVKGGHEVVSFPPKRLLPRLSQKKVG